MGRRPGSVGATCLQAREPHPDARGVGGVPPGSTVPPGLRGRSPTQGRIRPGEAVSAGGGARPPGRRPRRTSRVGGVASQASLRRSGPRPSRCHLVDSPTTSRPASRLASSMPSSPGEPQRLGRDAQDPLDRERAMRKQAARVACLPCSGTAAAPASRSGTCSARANHAPSSTAAQSCSAPPKGTRTGPEASRPEQRAGPRRRAPPQVRRRAARRELPRPGALRGRRRAGGRRRARWRAEPAPLPAPST